MVDDSTSSVEIFQAALSSGEPVKALMDLAARFLNAEDMESLGDVGVMLDDRLIHYVRNDATEALQGFVHALLAFIDTRDGDRLRSSPEGSRLMHRWEHLVDLCRIAVENYDSRRAMRLVTSRKYGEQLIRILDSQGSIRFKDLAEKLGVKQPYLARLLKELEKEDMVVREHGKNVSMVRLGFMGRVIVKEMEPEAPCSLETAAPRAPDTEVAEAAREADTHSMRGIDDDDPYGERDLSDEARMEIVVKVGEGGYRAVWFPPGSPGTGESPDSRRKSERSQRHKKAA